MAFPASFNESNGTLSPPEGVPEELISSISIWRGIANNGELQAETTITCWKLTKEELAEINRTGRVWMGVIGPTMLPAWISGHSPF